MKKMTRYNTLFIKIFVAITFSFGLVIAVFVYILSENQKSSLYDGIYEQAKTIASSIKLVAADSMLIYDYSFIVEHSLKVLESNGELKYILFNDNKDTNIFIDRKSWSLINTMPENIKSLHKESIVYDIVKSDLFDQKVFHLAYPVDFTGIEWGWINIGFSTDKIRHEILKIYSNAFIIYILILLISVIFSYFFAKWLVKPIVSLNDASMKIAQGDMDVELKADRKDEIGELIQNFNMMAKKLHKYTSELKDSKLDLEKRVEDRTKELQELNKDLDNRVKEEILKRSQQEQIMLHQSRHAAMGEMIGNIAHQWRQPLNALGLILQNIESAHEMGIIDDAFIQRVISKGKKLTHTMSKTIDDFRNFFQPNKLKEYFSFADAYLDTKDIISSSFDHNNIMLIEEIDKSVGVFGYENEFAQVVLNILNNAKDALQDKERSPKTVTVQIYKDDKYNYFAISDNAGGIPMDIMQKIFDPYFTTKDEGKGTGIGLYMSKTIIESNMHGKLSVSNSDKGACFKIIIPRDKEEI